MKSPRKIPSTVLAKAKVEADQTRATEKKAKPSDPLRAPRKHATRDKVIAALKKLHPMD
jgi:hypothetical protein